jgi:hypothetical protein
MKKKAYFENIETEFQQMQRENSKLKLDNAALRAENQLLKRYLNYFENLFAKKSGVSSVTTKSELSNSKNDNSMDSAPIGQVVDLEGAIPYKGT